MAEFPWLQEALSHQEQTAQWRRALHQIPETGLVLPKTSAFVREKLDSWGISYQTYERHSGIVAVLGKAGGKVVALRADMDALKMEEEGNLPFKSQHPGCMHACGHDCHTAILLTVAKLLKQREHELSGQVKLLFQPAEEGPGGAQPMVEDGVLEQPQVDAIFALHMDVNPELPVGALSLKSDTMFAADDQLNLSIIGQGGHGSQPHLCVDPIVVTSMVVSAMQTIVSREVDPHVPAVITFGSIHGGTAENIIPNQVDLMATIRNGDLQTREYVLRRIGEVVDGITKATRATYRMRYRDSYPPLINDEQMVHHFVDSAKKIVPETDICWMEHCFMGGDDAAYFFEQVPGCYFMLNAPLAFDDGRCYPAHNTRFRVDDSILYRGTALLLQTVTDYLQK